MTRSILPRFFLEVIKIYLPTLNPGIGQASVLGLKLQMVLAVRHSLWDSSLLLGTCSDFILLRTAGSLGVTHLSLARAEGRYR